MEVTGLGTQEIPHSENPVKPNLPRHLRASKSGINGKIILCHSSHEKNLSGQQSLIGADRNKYIIQL